MQEDFKSLKPEQLEALKQLLGEAYNVQLPDASDWFDGKQIDEIAFGEYLLRKKERKCIHGKLYDLDGEISDEVIRKEILDEIRPYQKTNVAKVVDRILSTLKLMCQCEMPPLKEDRVHFSNGTYYLDGTFTEEKEWTMNRLPVRYDPEIFLTTKDRPADRKDDRYLGDKLIRETKGIVLWCLEGLHRLVRNGFEFSISDRARKNLKDLMENENNIISFLNSAGYVRREEGTYASSRRLYAAYRKWCEDNLERPRAENTFKKYLNENAETLGLTYDKNLPGRNGKTVRGFRGIHVEVRTE